MAAEKCPVCNYPEPCPKCNDYYCSNCGERTFAPRHDSVKR